MSSKKEKKKKPYANNDGWLLTFTDVVALMLTFFVLLFSMSNSETEDFIKVIRSLEGGFRTLSTPPLDNASKIHTTTEITKTSFDQGLDLGYLSALIHQQIQTIPILENSLIEDRGGMLVLSLSSDALFDSGSAQIKKDGEKAVLQLGSVLKNLKNKIEVRGHTDPTPLKQQNISNWGLSLARAQNVAQILYESGYRKDISILGLADKEFSKTPQNLAQKERYNHARRVEIVIQEYKTNTLWSF